MKKRCITPCSHYKPEKVVSWLNEWSGEGLVLKKWGGFLVSFEEEEKRGYRYAFDADDGAAEPNWQRCADNQKAGWEYVCTLPAKNIHIYRTMDSEAVMADAEKLRKAASRKKRNEGLVYGLLVVFFAAILILPLSQIRWWLLELMDMNAGRMLPTMVLLILYAGTLSLEARKLFQLSRRLKEPLPASFPGTERPDFQRSSETASQNPLEEGGNPGTVTRKRRAALYGIGNFLSFLLLLAYLPFVFLSRTPAYEELGADTTVPYVDILSLDEDFTIGKVTYHEDPDLNWANRIEEKRVFFAKHYWETNQSANGKGLEEGVSLTGRYWEVDSPKIRETLYEQLKLRYIQYEWFSTGFLRYEDTSDAWELEEREDSRFERLSIARGTGENWRGDTCLVFVETGDYVMFFDYYGELDEERLLAEIHRLFP